MIIPGKLFNTTKVKHDFLINRSSVGDVPGEADGRVIVKSDD